MVGILRVFDSTYVELGYAAGYRDEIETALLEFADNDNYRVGSASPTAWHELTRIYTGKLAFELERSMVDLHLALVDQRSRDLLAHRDVAAIVLAITAGMWRRRIGIHIHEWYALPICQYSRRSRTILCGGYSRGRDA